MRVGVVGAGGRMGLEVCRAVAGQDDLELAVAVDPRLGGTLPADLATGRTAATVVAADVSAVVDAGCEVAVDFTRADAAVGTLATLAGAGIHAVVGTTGFSAAEMEDLGRRFSGPPNAVVAANFAIGAVLLMRFAELAAPWFESAEIVELHHPGKVDAPSGTALATAARMADARREAGAGPVPPDVTERTVLPGARGGEGPGGVRVHSVRLPGLVAHQEVLLGAAGQLLTLRHDSTDRSSFMDGVVLAVRRVPSTPGLTVGLEPLLGL